MRIVVGLSGGVDSSVAAWLLKQAGHEVVGIFMRNWHDETVVIDNACPWIDDANDAMLVAAHLGIPFQVLDLSAQYKDRIVDYMFNEYASGRTPNPDVLCNREIKFDVFLKAAQDVGAEAVATGHYCRKSITDVNGIEEYQLLSGLDGNKDQSYFLCQLTQAQLALAQFPIGELTKPRVREIAAEIGLPTADKKDSQGLCFIGKVRLPEFLQQELKPKTGAIIEISAATAAAKKAESLDASIPLEWDAEDGQIVGEHSGAHYFTVGQRRGIQVGGKKDPLFVIEKNVQTNTLYVGQGETHPGLLRTGLRMHLSETHWIRPSMMLADGASTKAYQFRIRYRQPLQTGILERKGDYVYIWFESPQSGVASGQFAAWYDGPECVGSGVIAS